MTEEKTTTESENQATEETAIDTTTYEDGVENVAATEEQTVVDGQTQETKKEETTETEKETKPINQEAVDKKINKVVFEKHEEKRKREEVEKQLAETKQQLQKLQQPESGELVVPELPDPYDFDFNKKIKEREDIILKNAEVRAKKQVETESLLLKQQELQQQSANENQKKVTTMYEKAAELGFENEEFAKADQRVAMFIQDPGLATFILDNENSSLIVQYLSQNVGELEKISAMNPIQAAVHISTNLLPEAVKLKPGTTKTPDPLELPSGRGAGEKQSQYLDGVQLE